MSKHDSEFVNTVLRSGTVTDKVSALSLLIQQSPIYSFNMLQSTLLSMANKKSRREAIMAIDSIKDLLLSTLLPDRKLRFFRDQPLSATGVTQKHLLLYYFEDSLKKLYFSFIQTIEELSKDTLLHVKNKMVIYIYDLLVAKPEQEQNLLALLVNKLVYILHLISIIGRSRKENCFKDRSSFIAAITSASKYEVDCDQRIRTDSISPEYQSTNTVLCYNIPQSNCSFQTGL